MIVREQAAMPAVDASVRSPSSGADANAAALPSVTIGLPVFNGGETLAKALATLVAQDYPNLRIVISDNASTDGTLATCEAFAERDPRIRIIRKRLNEGAVSNFRTVLEAADSEYFMWAAADDYWHPQFIRTLLPALEADSAVGVAMCAVRRSLPDGTFFDLIRFRDAGCPNDRNHFQLFEQIVSGAKLNLFIYGVFRTRLLKGAMRSFPEVLGGDRMFIAQMALACRFAYVDEILLDRTHQPSHASSYVNAMAQKGTLRRQLFAFSRMVLGSRVIPFHRKLAFPVFLIGYLSFGLRQKPGHGANILMSLTRKLYLSPRRLVTIAAAAVVAVAALVVAALSGLISSDTALVLLALVATATTTIVVVRAFVVRFTKVLSGRVAELRSETDSRIGAVRRDLAAKLATVHQEVVGRIDEVNGRNDARFDGVLLQLKALHDQIDSTLDRGLGHRLDALRRDLIAGLQEAKADMVSRGDLMAALQEAKADLASRSDLAAGLMDARKALDVQLESIRADGVADRALRDRTAREIRYLGEAMLQVGAQAPRDKALPVSDYLVQRIDKHRKIMAFVRRLEASRIREVYLEELFPGIADVSVPIGVINELTGHPNKVDMLYVSAVAKFIGAVRMFEFGTYMGRTTLHLARNNPDGKVVTVNLPASADPRYAPFLGSLLAGQPELARIDRIESDSRALDTTPYRGQFDFVFVDGDHSYEAVQSDTRKAFELLAPRGVIMWHDYAPKSEGLVEFFEQFTQTTPLFRIRSTCLLVHIDGVDVMNHTLAPMPDSLEARHRRDNPFIEESLYHL